MPVQAYQDLYDNKDGMRDDFVAFWYVLVRVVPGLVELDCGIRAETSRQFKGKKVLGFELINEPFAGDVYSDPLMFIPGEAGSKNLMPLYDATIPAILAVDPDRLVFYEPVTWGMVRASQCHPRCDPVDRMPCIRRFLTTRTLARASRMYQAARKTQRTVFYPSMRIAGPLTLGTVPLQSYGRRPVTASSTPKCLGLSRRILLTLVARPF
jgi:hypothetical protein